MGKKNQAQRVDDELESIDDFDDDDFDVDVEYQP